MRRSIAVTLEITVRVAHAFMGKTQAKRLPRTAEALGFERETLHRILKRLGLRADEFRA